MKSPRFLIVRFSAIGDCVMAAWAATAIRNRYPDAFICWAVEERCAPVIDRQRLVDQVVEVPREKWRGRGLSLQVLREQVALCNRVRMLKCDFGFDLQGHLKTAICLKFAFPKKRVACGATDGLSRVMNPVSESMPADVHWVDWHLRVLNQLGDFQLPQRPIMPEAGSIRPKLATISTSAGHPTKVYPAEKWREVAEELQADGYQVAFLGAKGDPDVSLPGATSFVGRLSLAESMRMVAESELHLAGDTGTGHMAAAYGVPVVSVFGHMDPVRYRPYTSQGVVLRRGTEAKNIEPAEVVSAARSLMGVRNG